MTRFEKLLDIKDEAETLGRKGIITVKEATLYVNWVWNQIQNLTNDKLMENVD